MRRVLLLVLTMLGACSDTPTGVDFSRYPVLRDYNATPVIKVAIIDRATWDSDPTRFQQYGPIICDGSGQTVCSVLIYDKLQAPPLENAPLTGTHDKPLFTYWRNTNTGYEKALWNCAEYPGHPPESCIDV